ncbi:ABC transporter permease [Candidatus Galacturonibacter soehngenii]|uniref:ABC transporter permease n=1 Tax=Candidatus Galacturonatibacter soehngenii TaxID=2307010 RepID=A0A7V7QNI3_9FIRM|nr:ABC transporter permease [Candidatus Galacturonibacter soehngenii]KAB1440524.1 ABC transporter permease [Candidatus Galacturonibacter soehngenii]MBA4687777.1 ABC transporter permease [Candidatus Galacturonibacter soehngenii]
MQVFKAYFKILRDSIPGLFIYLVIFIAISFFLSGSGKESTATTFTKNKVKIAVINEDEGGLGEGLKSYLSQIHTLVPTENDKEMLQDQLYYRNIEYILFIPKDFTNKIKNNEKEHLCENVKVPASYTGKYLDSQVDQYISTLITYVIAGIDDKQALEYTKSDLEKEVSVQLLNESISISKADDYYYFKYLPYIFISVVVMGISPILMTFYKKEINERNLCSPMTLKTKSIGLVAGSIVTVLGIFVLFLVFAFFLYGKNMEFEKTILYIINCISFLSFATGLGYLVSIFSSNHNILNMITNVCGLGMSFLGGIFVPREVLGEKVIALSKFLPTYWYVNAVEAIQEVKINPSIMKEFQINIGVQLLFAIAMFAIALAGTKYKSDARKQVS